MRARSAVLLTALLAVVVCQPRAALGQERADSAFAHGPRHVISLAMGMLPRMNASSAGVKSDGMLGGISYQYWLDRDWTLEVAGSVHSTEATAWGTHAVASLLLGGNWYPRPLAPSPALRPYLGAAVGAYTASETDIHVVRTQSVAGARVGGGVDAFPAPWLRLGLRAAYHLAPDYDTPVHGLRNAAGPELSLQLGVAFGHR